MIVNLNHPDREKVEALEKTRINNFKVLEMFSNYLNIAPEYITKKLIDSVTSDCNVDDEYAFYAIMSAACGLDIEENSYERGIARDYLLPSIKKLNTKMYTENPYYKNIKIPDACFGRWELKLQEYQPYEAFIYNDITVDGNFKELPHLGFFDEKFSFPAVSEDDNEWMAIKPNEIETMQPCIDTVSGRVVTFGLGLGYFAYMASEKANVSSVTVVERDRNVIALFEKYILPQFSHKEKIVIVCYDAFDYAEKFMAEEKFDFAFTDLWHDASDGVDLYLKMKKYERANPRTHFLYWIENTLLSYLRWLVFDEIYSEMKCLRHGYALQNGTAITSFEQICEYLGNDYLKKLAFDIRKI